MSQILVIGEFFHQNEKSDDGTPDLAVAVAADELAIPVTHAFVAKTTGGDAEACTLADGKVGQLLTVHLTVDGGGDATITPANATGWATVVLADAGDQAVFLYTGDEGGWRIWSLTGPSGPPAHTV